MRRLAAAYRRNNVLIRIVFSYALVCLLFIGVFSYAVMNRVSGDLTADINESNQRMTEQMYYTADLLLSSTYNHFAQVFGNNELVFNAMYGDSFDAVETYQINEYLNNLLITNPMVRSIYVYNMKKKLVFSSMSMVSDIKDFFDADMTKMLGNGDFYKQGNFIPRQERFDYLNKKYDKNLITVIYTKAGRDKAIEGALVLNLDQQVFHNLVDRGNRSSTQQSFILNGKGTVVSGSDNVNGNNGPDGQLIQKILRSDDTRGRMIETIQGKKDLISYIKSDRLGWTLVGVTEYGNLLQKVNANKRFIVWVSVFFVLAAALTAFFSTRAVYSPLRRLVNRVRTSSVAQKETAALNEYDLLATSFSSYEDLVRHLQTKVSDFKPSKKNELLRSIVCDGVSPSSSLLEEMGIRLNGKCYLVGLLRIDGYEEMTKRYDTSDIMLLKYAMTNIAQEIIAPHCRTEAWSDNEDSVILILNMDDEDCAMNELEQHLRMIQTHIAEYLRLSVTISIGTATGEIGRIRHSWQHAYRLSQYRLVCGSGCIITQEIEDNRDSSGKEAVLSLEKTILESLKSGDREMLSDSFADFKRLVSGCQYDDLIEYLSQLMLVTLRAAKGIMTEEELLQSGVYSLPQALYQWETLDQIGIFYMKVVESALTLRERRLSGKKPQIVERMVDIIKSQYGKPDFSVEQLAAMVELSTNYARKIFKDEMGISISQYMTDYRFAIAQDLLLETDLPASRVGEMVGIVNKNYFYAAFKKYSGKTPDQFRRGTKPKTTDEMTGTDLSDA